MPKVRYLIALLVLFAVGCSGEPSSTSNENAPIAPVQTGQQVQGSNHSNHFAPLAWLPGKWRYTKGNRSIYEMWDFSGDSIIGSGWFVSETDSVLSEELAIVYEDGLLNYVANVEHNDAPIHFAATMINDTMLLFENPGHDFPTAIQYLYRQPDSLLVSVMGMEDNAPKQLNFFFIRQD